MSAPASALARRQAITKEQSLATLADAHLTQTERLAVACQALDRPAALALACDYAPLVRDGGGRDQPSAEYATAYAALDAEIREPTETDEATPPLIDLLWCECKHLEEARSFVADDIAEPWEGVDTARLSLKKTDFEARARAAEERAQQAAAQLHAAQAKAPGAGQPKPEAVMPRVVNMTALHGVPIPAPQWLVRNWIPVGYATLVYGPGGTGKTLLGQQLLTACATGMPWLGMDTEPCKAFGFFCEDGLEVIHHRQSRINARLSVDFENLENMRVTCPVGEDNVLLRFRKGGVPEQTDRFRWLREQVLDFDAGVLYVDTAATTFGGNENDRAQCTAFVGVVLTCLAQEMRGGKGGAVMVAAHPSRSGMYENGHGTSGSTGWVGSARSTLLFNRPKVSDGVADPNVRLLTLDKVNEAQRGAELTLRWQEGFFEAPASGMGGAFAAVSKGMAVEATFLDILRQCESTGRRLSPSKQSSDYAPKACQAHTLNTTHYSKRDFERAMEALRGSNRIRTEEYKRSGHFSAYLVVAESYCNSQLH